MQMNIVKCTGFLIFLVLLALSEASAQDNTTVLIEFDKQSQRIDLITGEKLPDFRYVERGSIRFFLNRLDKSDDFVYFTHDGLRKVQINRLKAMEKVQPKFAIWRLRYKSGSKNTPRIQHLAVSFIPLSTTGKNAGKRVYVLLNDLKLIDWGE